MGPTMSHLQRVFQGFCESTSLHGYSYLFIATSFIGRLFFVLVIIVFTFIGMYFLGLNYDKYAKATFTTTIDTTSAPLEVNFKYQKGKKCVKSTMNFNLGSSVSIHHCLQLQSIRSIISEGDGSTWQLRPN